MHRQTYLLRILSSAYALSSNKLHSRVFFPFRSSFLYQKNYNLRLNPHFSTMCPYHTNNAMEQRSHLLSSDVPLIHTFVWACVHISETFRRLRLALAAQRIQELDQTLSLIQRLCYIFICAMNWKLNAQATEDVTLLAGRTIRLLVQMHRILKCEHTTRDIDVPVLSSDDIVNEMPYITGQWTVTKASLNGVRSVSQVLRMVTDVMHLMQQTDDYRYESCESH